MVWATMADTPAAEQPQSHLVQNYGRQDIRFVSGTGCWLTDDQGRRHLDAFAGVAVCALGHAHPALVETIRRQVGVLVHTSNHYHIIEQERLAAAIVAGAFPGRVLFCNSGTEANEAAYKVVRLWGNQVHAGRKTRMLAFQNGFHGRTLGALSITANPAYREPFAPLPAAEFLPFGDLAAARAAFADDVAGVFVEPIQGEGGVNVAPPGFLAGLRELCDRHGALLVIDEIQTGVARTGTMYAHQHDGVVPDIMTLAKGLGGGIPIGAALYREHCAALLKPPAWHHVWRQPPGLRRRTDRAGRGRPARFPGPGRGRGRTIDPRIAADLPGSAGAGTWPAAGRAARPGARRPGHRRARRGPDRRPIGQQHPAHRPAADHQRWRDR